jgi:hypothetical protein
MNETISIVLPAHCSGFRKIVALLLLCPILLLLGTPCPGQDDPGPPSLDGILDTDPIPENERPAPRNLILPETLPLVPVPVSADERQEISTWVKWMVLKNLPPNYEDNRKWDKRKEVFVGLHIHRDGLKIETKRKTKLMKHGTWTRYTIDFVDPEQELIVDVSKIDFSNEGRIDITTRIEAPLKLFGRVSQWQRNVRWYSLSMHAQSRVEMNVECSVYVHVNSAKFPPDVEFSPIVTSAKVQLKEFEVDRISRVGGDAAELIGKGIREVLDEKMKDYDDKLVEKMNREIAKQKDKLTLSLSDWLGKKVGTKSTR